jgi:thiosulfate reductase cytochrome b subunit
MTDQPPARVPLWIRVSHWLITLPFLLLVLTGVVLHFTVPGIAVMPYALATTMHDWAGIALSIVYGLFLLTILITGYWRNYVPRHRGFWGRIREQVAAYTPWTATAKAKAPAPSVAGEPRFNVLQQIAYLIVVFAVLPLLVVTGLVYLYPEYAPDKVLEFGGVWPIALAHVVAGALGTGYVMVHAYMATMGGMSRMLSGRLTPIKQEGR